MHGQFCTSALVKPSRQTNTNFVQKANHRSLVFSFRLQPHRVFLRHGYLWDNQRRRSWRALYRILFRFIGPHEKKCVRSKWQAYILWIRPLQTDLKLRKTRTITSRTDWKICSLAPQKMWERWELFVDRTKTPEVVTILPVLSSIAAFIIYETSPNVLYSRIFVFTWGHSPKFVWQLWAHKEGTICAVKIWKSVLFAAQDRIIERCFNNSRWGMVASPL